MFYDVTLFKNNMFNMLCRSNYIYIYSEKFKKFKKVQEISKF